MPRFEDLPKKPFKPKRRNSWDLASILDSVPDGREASAETVRDNALLAPEDISVSNVSLERGDKPIVAATKPSDRRLGIEPEPDSALSPGTATVPSIGSSADKELVTHSTRSVGLFETELTTDVVTLPGAQISPANDQHIASISPAEAQLSPSISPANDQHIASISPANRNPISPAYRQQAVRAPDTTSKPPAESPANDQHTASKRPAYRQQTTSIPPAKVDVASLSGKEAQLVRLIFQQCRLLGSRTTEPTSSEDLARVMQIRTKRLNNVVERLVSKGVIAVLSQKPGRGAWRRFSLSDSAYHWSSLHEIASKPPAEPPANDQHIASISPANDQHTASKSPAIPPAELSSSSGSSSILHKATNTSEHDSALPPGWAAIDVTQLGAIGFTQTHVRQLHRAGLLTPDEIQDSVHAFAFDLEVNGKAAKLRLPAVNYLMGILRKGPYAPPDNYESPESRQRRLYLEAKEKAQKRRREEEERLEAVEFEDWFTELSSADRGRFVPETQFVRLGSPAHRIELRNYFRENIWPELRLRAGKGNA